MCLDFTIYKIRNLRNITFLIWSAECQMGGLRQDITEPAWLSSYVAILQQPKSIS